MKPETQIRLAWLVMWACMLVALGWTFMLGGAYERRFHRCPPPVSIPAIEIVEHPDDVRLREQIERYNEQEQSR